MAAAIASAAAAVVECGGVDDTVECVAVPRPVKSHPLIERIQSLLLPQDFGDDQKHWQSQCTRVCSDVDAYDRDPSNPPLDASQWLGATRPQWPDEDSARADDAYPTPLFAFVRLTQTFGPDPAADLTAAARALFRVLLRCGCGRADVLNARDARHCTPLTQAVCAPEPEHVVPWLVDAVAVDVAVAIKTAADGTGAQPWAWSDGSPPCAVWDDDDDDARTGTGRCCVLCRLVARAVAKPTLDTAALSAVARLTDAQVLERMQRPHTLFCSAMNLGDVATVVIARAERAWRSASVDVAQRRALHDALFVAPQLRSDGFYGTALSCAAAADEGTAWRVLTDPSCAIGPALLRHANSSAQFGREWVSPLTAAIDFEVEADAEAAVVAEADRRCSWLVPRLCSEQLNKYNSKCRTALHYAVARKMPLTLKALLVRVRDLDLTLPESTVQPVPSVPPDRPLCAADFASQRTVAQALAAQTWDTPRLEVLARDLAIKTKWQCELLPPLIAAVARPVLETAQLPREIVALCFAYAALPLPSDAEAAGAPAPKRQRTN